MVSAGALLENRQDQTYVCQSCSHGGCGVSRRREIVDGRLVDYLCGPHGFE